MCRRIGAPNVKAHLDVYHMNIEEFDPGASHRRGRRLSRLLPHRKLHRGYMGSGNVDLQSVFRALVRSGYGGPIAFGSLLFTRGRPAARGHSRLRRNLWEDGGDLAVARADVTGLSSRPRRRRSGRPNAAGCRRFRSRGRPFRDLASTHASPSPQAESTPPREKPDKRPRWVPNGGRQGTVAAQFVVERNHLSETLRRQRQSLAQLGVRAGLGQRSAGRPRSREGDLQRCDRRGTSRRKANRHLHLDRVRGRTRRHHGAGAERGRPGQ